MEHPYKVVILRKSKKGLFPSMLGEILEHDVIIGRFWRTATVDGFVPPIEYRFYSEASKARFDDFADSLTISETIEALIPRN